MSEEPNLVGTMLGSYRITGELSRGGMGAVYRAEHSVLERTVAVKLLRPDLTTNAELVSRFINEAKAASAIHHPGIIEVLDFGHAQDGRAYFVMEMLQGESLGRRIESRGKLPPREAATIAGGIASALTAAHGKGIVHRDLKPDNVFLIPDPYLGERPKVLDFGIAKLGEVSPNHTKYTQTGALMGTPMYMAPEQARTASAIDHRADLYSVGCILYEMLVGEPPFVAVGAGEIIALQMFGKATPPSERVAGIPPALDQIVMRLLEKEPEDRYQSAGELGTALEAAFVDPRAGDSLAGGQPVILPTQHDLPAARRSRVIVALLAASVVAAIVAVVVIRRGADHSAAAPAQDPAIVEVPPPAPVPVEATPPVPVEIEAKPAQPAQPAPVREKPRAGQKAGTEPAKVTRKRSPIETAVD
jgi:eukaryotic-like serine/threonine-protein kinase